jgi:macrophage-stimulating 1 receptor
VDSSTWVHTEFSDSKDESCVPLLRTESIRLKDLDTALLAEVKDVLIPHERVVTHSDQVIGKGMEARLGGGAGVEMKSQDDINSKNN